MTVSSNVWARISRWRQAMDAIREPVVGARDIHQLLQLALERLVALAQHFHLALDQAHGGAGVAQMRQAQLGEQGAVALEEIRIGLQILGDACRR